MATSAAIEQIRAAIRNQAELAEMSAAESLANDAAANAGLGIFVESTRKSIEDLRTVTPVALRRAADHAWQKYTAKYNEPARLSWQNTFNSELKSFDSRYIAPLAEAHAGWMKSPQMADYFDCNFDSNDAERGLVYVTLLTQCIAGTQDKGACAALYDHWLSANDPSDHGNLLLRAMTLNLDVVADKVAEAAKASVDPRILQWDALLAVRDKAIERVKTEANDIYARFIAEFGGPIARALGRWADGTPGMRAAVMATGLISGHPIALCELVGGKKTFRAALIRKLIAASGQVPSQHEMQRAVSAELRRLEINGIKLDGTDKKRWILMADAEQLGRVPAGLKGQASADWLASNIRTIEQVEGLNLDRWRTVINGSVRVGIIAGTIQFVSLGKLQDDAQNAMSNDANDAKHRAYAGIAALGGTTADVIGNVLVGRAKLGLRFGQGAAMRSGAFLTLAGKGAGLGVGLVFAGLHVVKAYEAFEEHKPGLTIAYGLSAFAGAGISVALLGTALLGAAAIPIIGILVLLLIGITVLIEYLKDNKIQDWLERTQWGVLKSQHYSSFQLEQQELKLALQG